MTEDEIILKAKTIVFKHKDGTENSYDLGDIEEVDEELIPDQYFETPQVFHKNENQTFIINAAGKLKDGTAVVMGRSVEKLGKVIKG